MQALLDREVGEEVSGNTIAETFLEPEEDLKGVRKACWFVTILNPTDGEVNALKSLKFRYLVYQHEICPSTGTPHLHALLYYQNPVVWPKRSLPRANIQRVKSLPAAIEYCKKEESRDHGPYEFGEVPEQGRRKDLEQLAKEFLVRTEAEFAEENPGAFVRYNRGLREFKSTVLALPRDASPEVNWLWGPTGVGKSYTAYHRGETCYIKDGTMWWNGYRNQQVILIDDFDGKWPYRDLLRLLDRYPYQGQVKGGYVEINSPIIYITCEFPPEQYWEDNALDQVLRRITNVRHITRENV